jgi:hypothetical protein
MLYELFSFINENKLSLFKVLSIISFTLIFVKPLYGFSVFFIGIVMLAYCDKIMEYLNRSK